MSAEDFIQMSILVLLLLLSAFFSSAETALTTVNHIRIQALCEEGNRRAAKVLKVTSDPGKMLSTILIGNNIVNLTASSLATTLSMRLFGSRAIGAATGILTLLVLIFGEITPKTIAAASAEKLSLSYAPVISRLMIVMTPVIIVVHFLAGLVLRCFHVQENPAHNPITEKELRTLVDVGHEDGIIEAQEHRMINNVFDFVNGQAKEVMVPRMDMVVVSTADSYETIREIFRNEKYSRLPVYDQDPDNIIGFINIKDFLFYQDLCCEAQAEPDSSAGSGRFDIRRILYEPYFTYEYKHISELLREMRQKSVSLTIVLDEYGAVAGMVTLEDLLEELVGEIRDEYDEDEKNLIRRIGPGEYLIEGAVKLDDVNDALGTALDSEDYDSVGGYMIEKLDHLPEEGESVMTPHGDLLRVKAMDKNRIDLVYLKIRADEQEA